MSTAWVKKESVRDEGVAARGTNDKAEPQPITLGDAKILLFS